MQKMGETIIFECNHVGKWAELRWTTERTGNYNPGNKLMAKRQKLRESSIS